MSDLITYDDKIRLKSQNVSEKYKVTAGDMNEIKRVVNNNAEEVDEINKPENWVSVGATAPENGERVWFEKRKNLYKGILYAENKYMEDNGTIGDNSNYNIYANNVEPNKEYSFSFVNGESVNRFCRLLNFDVNNNFISLIKTQLVNGSDSFSYTFTTPANASKLYISFGKMMNNAQLEEGPATTYEPYKEPSIYVDEEEWYSKPKLLWSGKATSVDVDLTGYSIIEVIFCSNDNIYNSLKVPVSGSTFSRALALCNSYLSDPMSTSGSLYLKYGKATLTQSGITIKANVEVQITNTASQIRWRGATNTLLYITTIIGYK